MNLLVASCFSILLCAFATLVMPTPAANAQCEADHTIVMADYYFAPSELTIEPGETVAFINVQGTHNINGISNTLTGTSWGNPVEFFLDETTICLQPLGCACFGSCSKHKSCYTRQRRKHCQSNPVGPLCKGVASSAARRLAG